MIENQRDFLSRMDSRYEKDSNESKLEEVKWFLDRNKVPDGKLEDLYYLVQTKHKYSYFPSLAIFEEALGSLSTSGPDDRDPRYERHMEDRRRWVQFSADKVIKVCEAIREKWRRGEDMHSLEVQFIYDHAPVEAEYNWMIERDFSITESLERVEYVLGKVRSGEDFLSLREKEEAEDIQAEKAFRRV